MTRQAALKLLAAVTAGLGGVVLAQDSKTPMSGKVKVDKDSNITIKGGLLLSVSDTPLWMALTLGEQPGQVGHIRVEYHGEMREFSAKEIWEAIK